MFNNPKILVCSDFSSYSDNALRAAGEFARKTGGKVQIVHVAQISYYMNLWGVDKWFTEDIKNEFISQLEGLLHDQAVKCNVTADCEVIFDTSITHAVFRKIEKEPVDIIFIGFKGISGIEKYLLGSVARKIASSSPVPVMIIKGNYTDMKIAALVDGSEDLMLTIEVAQEVSGIYHSSLAVISLVPSFPNIYSVLSSEYSMRVVNAMNEQVTKSVDEIKGRISSLLPDNKSELTVKCTNERDVGYHLTEILDETGIKLAVMKRHGKGFVDHFMLGSVSQRILELYKGNILIVN